MTGHAPSINSRPIRSGHSTHPKYCCSPSLCPVLLRLLQNQPFADVAPLLLRSKVTTNQVTGIFGFDGGANIGKVAFPAIQVHPQLI